MRKLSPRRLVSTFRRFPIPALFILAFAITSFAFIDADVNDNERTWFFCFFYFASGGVLALALSLWSEQVDNHVLSIAVPTLVHVLWMGVSFYMASIVVSDFDVTYVYASVALCLFVIVVLFLLSFFREKTDLAMCDFAQQFIGWTALSVAVAGILTLGLSLLLLSFDKLFGIYINTSVYEYVFAFCFALLCPVLLLQQIPDSGTIHSVRPKGMSRFFLGVIHYLYIPLLGAYLLTLYLYAAKILLTWQLPVGWVSSLVSWSVVGMLLLTFLLYPAQFADNRRFDRQVLRWLPLIILPLLVLMSVGIGRRISDYGFTNARLYLAVFNVWCYAVCIGLVLTRVRRLWWIPASFAIVGVAVSVGPQGIATIVKNTMVENIVESANTGRALTEEEEAAIASRLRYLRNSYHASVVDGLCNNPQLNALLYGGNMKSDIVFNCYGCDAAISIPKNCSKAAFKVETTDIRLTAGDRVEVKVEFGEQTFTFHTSLRVLKAHADESSFLLLRSQDGTMLVVDHYYVHKAKGNAESNSNEMRGNLFY